MVIKGCLQHVLLTVSAVISLSLSSIHGYVIWIVLWFYLWYMTPPRLYSVLRKYDNSLASPKRKTGFRLTVNTILQKHDNVTTMHDITL